MNPERAFADDADVRVRLAMCVHRQYIPRQWEVVTSPIKLTEGYGGHFHHQITVGAVVTGTTGSATGRGGGGTYAPIGPASPAKSAL